ncbi:MAG: maleylpyruvate isomerase family mycothiol-dependent enzyme [Actinomycetota bacterium]|nr:maleylpyruvate isomerase family mycothiol-dependent enzyme [Actinomycetota bacterium]
MSTETPADQVLDELRMALAQADARTPPPGLRGRVMAAAEVMRGAGHPFDPPPAISAIEAYRRTVEAFHTLLAELGDDEWRLPVLRGLDIQGLVGHLIGVERAFQVTLGIEPTAIDLADHVGGTQPDADAQHGRAPASTHQDWLARARRTIAHLESTDPAVLSQMVTLHGFSLPFAGMLVVRSFEMWTHEEDIRRATGRALLAPDGSRLALMTELAVAALPRGLENAGRPQPGRTARLVLTGPGGGTWQAPLERGAVPASPDVRIVVDATAFCRLVANRYTPSQVGATITGDQALGLDVLVGASALALD